MHTAGRTSRSTGIRSVVQLPPKCAGASRWVPKCSSAENFPSAAPSFAKVAVSVRLKAFSPVQVGSVSASGCPRSSTFTGRSAASSVAASAEAARAPGSGCRMGSPPWPRPLQHLVGGDAHDVGAAPPFAVPRLRPVAPFHAEQRRPRQAELAGGADAGERAMARPWAGSWTTARSRNTSPRTARVAVAESALRQTTPRSKRTAAEGEPCRRFSRPSKVNRLKRSSPRPAIAATSTRAASRGPRTNDRAAPAPPRSKPRAAGSESGLPG